MMAMPARHSARTVARQHAELAWAAPQVIAHRTARMLRAGATPGARDTAEFTRMFTEKASAFSQAWMASCMALWWAPWQVAMELLQGGAGMATGKLPHEALWRAWHRQGWGIAGSGLAPVHRTAVANARRLRRSQR